MSGRSTSTGVSSPRCAFRASYRGWNAWFGYLIQNTYAGHRTGQSMKLSCLPVSLYPDIIAGRVSLAAWARMGAELGLDAVDASILFFLPQKEF